MKFKDAAHTERRVGAAQKIAHAPLARNCVGGALAPAYFFLTSVMRKGSLRLSAGTLIFCVS
jgi:hypothetical protein